MPPELDDSFLDEFEELVLRTEGDPEHRLQHIRSYWRAARQESRQKARFASLLYTVAKAREGEMSDKPSYNITFNQSPVGNLNLGEQIGMIKTVLNAVATKGQDGERVATALRELTEAVRDTPNLSDPQKQEALGVISTVAREAEAAPEKRTAGVARSLLMAFPALIDKAKDVTALWDKWAPVVKGFFGSP